MPITVVKKKLRSDNGRIEAPYWVSDQTLAPGTEINYNLAIAAAVTQGNIDNSNEPTDVRVEQESHKSLIVSLTYPDDSFTPFPSPNQPPDPLPVGSSSFAFNAVSFKSEHLIASLKTKWRLPAKAAYGPAPDFEQLVNVQTWSSPEMRVIDAGYNRVLPPETDQVEYAIPNGDFTAEYRETIENCLWKVHGAGTPFFNRPAGEVMLVRAQSRQRNNDDLILSFGFSRRKNGPRQIGNVNTETIGAPPVEGHDLVWAVYFWDYVNAAPGIQLGKNHAHWIYCEEIWERADLNELRLPGSTGVTD